MFAKQVKRFLCVCIALLMLCCSALSEDAGDFSKENLETPQELCSAAMEVYSWFAMAPLDADPSLPDSTGARYRVYDDRLNTYEKLSSVVHEYFSDEISNMLLGSGVYAEEDGYLYTVLDTARPIDPSIVSTEYYLANETDSEREYNAAVFYADDTGEVASLEEYTLVMEKEDGDWVFTDFWFFW